MAKPVLLRSMTYRDRIPIKGLEFHERDSKGRHIYFQPSTAHWFMVQRTVQGWVVSEYEGGCDCE